MTGFGGRDRDHGCEGVRDPLFVRALYLEHGDCRAFIMAFDICFFHRSDADRCKGAIGRHLDVSPQMILLNASHTHAGPAVGRWGFNAFDAPPDPLYIDQLEQAAVRAACQAAREMRPATLSAGLARTTLPVKRRKPDGRGSVEWRPYPQGVVCNHLPIALFRDEAGKPLCLMFSVACHPSTVGGWLISADYPGAACSLLDEELGAEASMFLQGAGGDAKARVIADGHDGTDACWRQGSWDDVQSAGRLVAEEVSAALSAGLSPVKPALRYASLEMPLGLESPPERKEIECLLQQVRAEARPSLRQLWAERLLRRIQRCETLATSVPVTVHAIQIGEGLRIVGLEGEPVAELGLLMSDFYTSGITFSLGYTNGAQLYLPTSAMIDEGGYEVDSYYEYGFPAPLRKGIEEALARSLEELKARGIRQARAHGDSAGRST